LCPRRRPGGVCDASCQPTAPAPADAPGRPHGSSLRIAPRRITMARILIAEDDDSMRAFLARALRRAGHWVEAAPDGLAAIDTLAAQDFDLLLADVVMPGLDGVELARRATRQQPRLKVMFITGF